MKDLDIYHLLILIKFLREESTFLIDLENDFDKNGRPFPSNLQRQQNIILDALNKCLKEIERRFYGE